METLDELGHNDLRKQLFDVEAQLRYVRNLKGEEKSLIELKLSLKKKQIRASLIRLKYEELEKMGGRKK